jgi:hypothetical protein
MRSFIRSNFIHSVLAASAVLQHIGLARMGQRVCYAHVASGMISAVKSPLDRLSKC